MEVTRAILNKLSDKEIYNYLLNEITNIYNKYNYLDVPNEEIDKIIYEEIALSRDNYKDKYNYKKYVISRIEARIVALTTKIFNNDQLTCDVISKYISEYFTIPDDYNMALNYLKGISSLFLQFNYIPEPNIIISLINGNEIFSKILEIIVAKHSKYLKDYSVFQLFNDNNLASLIGIYCMVKGIPINNDYLQEIDNLSNDLLQDYYKEINKIPKISTLEMQDIGKRIKEGDEAAINRLIEGNLRLVVLLARRYYNVNNIAPLVDLVAAGNIGLMRAARKFDIDLGFRFSTYATYWIRLEMTKEVQKNGAITPVSLNDFIDDEGEVEIGDMVYDDSFTDGMEFKLAANKVQRLLKKCRLTEKQLMVILLRYGFYDGVTRTLEEVADILNVKRQAVGQLEARALYKLRTHYEIKQFAEYMDDPERAVKLIDKFNAAYRESSINHLRVNPLEDNTMEYPVAKNRVK